MTNYLRARLGEMSTTIGLWAAAIGAVLIAFGLWLGPESIVGSDANDIGVALVAAGLIAILIPNPKPPECG